MNEFEKIVDLALMEMAYGLGNSGDALSREELINYIIKLDEIGKGVIPVSFTSVTVPQYKKTGFPYKRLYKVGQTSGMIGTDYEANVNKQREREGVEGEFKSSSNSNIKERISSSVGVTTKGLTVLIYRPVNKASQPYWVVENNDGSLNEVNKEDIISFLYPGIQGSGTQGVENKIEYRTYGFDKIVGMSIENKEHIVSDIDPIKKQVYDLVADKLKH